MFGGAGVSPYISSKNCVNAVWSNRPTVNINVLSFF